MNFLAVVTSSPVTFEELAVVFLVVVICLRLLEMLEDEGEGRSERRGIWRALFRSKLNPDARIEVRAVLAERDREDWQ